MAKLGIGVVGAGSIGIRAALEHLSLPDVQDRLFLAAVCDPVPGRAQAAAAKYGVAHAYESYEELLNDSSVDAITVGSPIGIHFEQGMKAAKAGKHMHFNKTMTTTASEATQLIDAAKANNVHIVSSPGQMLRNDNKMIRELIEQGAIGHVAWAVTGAAFGTYHENESLRTGTDVLSNINPSWYWKKPGGGPLFDMTVYGLHSLTGVMGPATRVTAMSGIATPIREFAGVEYTVEADDNTLIVVDFGKASFAFVYGTPTGTVSAFGSPSYYGLKGQITGGLMNGEPIQYDGKEIVDAANGFWPAILPHVTGKHREMEEAHVFADIMQLVDLVTDGTPTVATPEHARHVIEIIEAAYIAASTGITQDLNTTF